MMADATQIVDGVNIGDVVAGKYLMEGIIGVGGMAVVAAAKHLALDERVAIKFLVPAAFDDDLLRQRFQREARAAVRIQSDHVARVLDVSTLPNESPYIVMEYLEGTDLARRLQRQGPLEVQELANYVCQACDAIGQAHTLGIVHRDVKPANLFVARQRDGSERVKVLDFGISKTALTDSGENVSLTRSRATLGSPLYMSPEQMASASTVDGRTDIWALGVTMFELLTGNVPFSGKNVPEVCLAVTQHETPSLRHHRPDIPDDFVQVVERCLEKDRDRRFSSTEELRYALAAFADGTIALTPSPLPRLRFTDRGVVVTSSTRSCTDDAPVSERETMPVPEPVEHPVSSSKAGVSWQVVALGAVLLIALGAGLAVGVARGSAQTPASSTGPPPDHSSSAPASTASPDAAIAPRPVATR
jgi:eukaryotic-like serine/threonine-protein kinase